MCRAVLSKSDAITSEIGALRFRLHGDRISLSLGIFWKMYNIRHIESKAAMQCTHLFWHIDVIYFRCVK